MPLHRWNRRRGGLVTALTLVMALAPTTAPARPMLDPAEIPPGLVGLVSQRSVAARGHRVRVDTFSCTGFVVAAPRGQEVITARHCLKPHTDMVIFDGEGYTRAADARMPARGPDVALVEPAEDMAWPEVEVGDSRDLRRGEVLCAWRVRSDDSRIYWDRVCSRFLGRRMMNFGSGAHPVLLMEHALAPGFSGGPVMDADGRVIGVGVAITRDGYDIVEPIEAAAPLMLSRR